ncbi:MAG: hypothetical protein LBU65_14915 [Planctomycetaceae bacterium]|nr:hypothetical protein [Planctomycetaceae bacterium]
MSEKKSNWSSLLSELGLATDSNDSQTDTSGSVHTDDVAENTLNFAHIVTECPQELFDTFAAIAVNTVDKAVTELSENILPTVHDAVQDTLDAILQQNYEEAKQARQSQQQSQPPQDSKPQKKTVKKKDQWATFASELGVPVDEVDEVEEYIVDTDDSQTEIREHAYDSVPHSRERNTENRHREPQAETRVVDEWEVLRSQWQGGRRSGNVEQERQEVQVKQEVQTRRERQDNPRQSERQDDKRNVRQQGGRGEMRRDERGDNRREDSRRDERGDNRREDSRREERGDNRREDSRRDERSDNRREDSRRDERSDNRREDSRRDERSDNRREREPRRDERDERNEEFREERNNERSSEPRRRGGRGSSNKVSAPESRPLENTDFADSRDENEDTRERYDRNTGRNPKRRPPRQPRQNTETPEREPADEHYDANELTTLHNGGIPGWGEAVATVIDVNLARRNARQNSGSNNSGRGRR